MSYPRQTPIPKRAREGMAAVCAGLCAGALALACSPPNAWAADNEGTTEVTVEADPNAMLLFRVPTVIPFYAAPDGTLTGPSAEYCQVVNESVFGIHVTSVGVTEQGGWTLASNAAAEGVENSMDFQFGPSRQVDAHLASENPVDVSSDPEFNMGYAGSGLEAINIQTAGDVARVTFDLSRPVSTSTIAWTVAPGFATEA